MATKRLLRSLRVPGWSRTVLVRRLVAGALVLLAGVLAVRPARDEDAVVVVAGHDLAPGATLSTSDVKAVRAPTALVPAGALVTPESASGRVLAGAAAAGEPITSARLLGPENTRLTAGRPDAAAVPVRLDDEDVAALLVPGSHVDIVGPDQTVVAEDATVVTVRAGDRGRRLVVVVLPRTVATRVAAASLARTLAVTLR
jgi:Flp pilus assembly protein CpaB